MNQLKALQDHRQAMWLDFLSRGFIADGRLTKLVDEDGKMHKPSDEHRAPGAAPPGKRRRLLDVAGNGRFIRNVIEDAFGEQMYRLSDLPDIDEVDDATLTTITADDLSTALTTVVASVAEDVLDPASIVRTNQ